MALRPGILIFAIAAASIGVAAYKVAALDYSFDVLVPDTVTTVELVMSAEGNGRDLVLRTYLPSTSDRQQIFDELNTSVPLALEVSEREGNRHAVWRASDVEQDITVFYTYTVRSRPWRWELGPELALAQEVPASVAPYLQETPSIQVNHPEIAAKAAALLGNEERMLPVLRRSFDFVANDIANVDASGDTDAITTLRLGEGASNGKSRLLVALLRRAGVPARLVGGLIIEPGTKRTRHQWVEAYVQGHWIAMSPTHGHFAAVPAAYLELYRGDHALFSHTKDIAFDWFIRARTNLVPSAALSSVRGHPLNVLNLYDLFRRIGISISLLKILLTIPIGALVATFFRNVIGTQTFGTFLPALIAAAARETGIVWGLIGFVIVILLVALVRRLFERFELLHTPKLSAMLSLVVAILLGISALAVWVDLYQLAHLAMFPIAVLTLTAERFAIVEDERGTLNALWILGQTLVVTACCYAFMSSVFLQMAILTFPELVGVLVALNLWLGRWMGLRVLELWRFRKLMASRQREADAA